MDSTIQLHLSITLWDRKIALRKHDDDANDAIAIIQINANNAASHTSLAQIQRHLHKLVAHTYFQILADNEIDCRDGLGPVMVSGTLASIQKPQY